MAPEPATDAFSVSEEAFFHSVPPPDDALPSERPVTLEQELFVTEAAPSSEREARRARFIRPVAMTLGVLAVLTLAGLARHASLAAQNERALITTSNAASAVTLPQRIAVATADEDPPELFMSAADERASLDSPASRPTEAEPVGDDAVPHDATPTARVLGHLPSAPDVVSREARRARHVSSTSPVPIGKSALLSAIRASRPAHASAQKTR